MNDNYKRTSKYVGGGVEKGMEEEEEEEYERDGMGIFFCRPQHHSASLHVVSGFFPLFIFKFVQGPICSDASL